MASKKKKREKTKLELLMYEKGITRTALTGIIGAKQTATTRKKLDGEVDFRLDEMLAIKNAVAPDMTLDEIFEDYPLPAPDKEEE